MTKDELKELEEFQGLYTDMLEIIEDQQIGEIIHIFAYILAEIVVDNRIPKDEFVEHLMDEFERAHGFLKLNKSNIQEH